MSIELVAIDLDATLLRDDKSFDKDRFLTIKAELLNRGIALCIATGNSFHKIVEYFNEDERQEIYFAVDNGNLIIQNEAKIHAITIDLPTAIQAVALFDAVPRMYSMVSDGMTAYFRNDPPEVQELFLKYNNSYAIVEDFNQLPETMSVPKISIWSFNDLEVNKTTVKHVMDTIPGIEAVTSGDGWMDAMHVDGGKGASIRYLEEYLRINTDKAMAFGDSLNDRSMMEVVGYSMAMGNADPDLLPVTKYQVGTNQDQAVLSVLEEMLAAPSLDFLEAYRIHK